MRDMSNPAARLTCFMVKSMPYLAPQQLNHEQWPRHFTLTSCDSYIGKHACTMCPESFRFRHISFLPSIAFTRGFVKGIRVIADQHVSACLLGPCFSSSHQWCYYRLHDSRLHGDCIAPAHKSVRVQADRPRRCFHQCCRCLHGNHGSGHMQARCEYSRYNPEKALTWKQRITEWVCIWIKSAMPAR